MHDETEIYTLFHNFDLFNSAKFHGSKLEGKYDHH